MQDGHLQAIVLKHISFDLIIGSLDLSYSQIQPMQFSFHLDTLLEIEFGQKNNHIIEMVGWEDKEIHNDYNFFRPIIRVTLGYTPKTERR